MCVGIKMEIKWEYYIGNKTVVVMTNIKPNGIVEKKNSLSITTQRTKNIKWKYKNMNRETSTQYHSKTLFKI
jgi:hypothetical protein